MHEIYKDTKGNTKWKIHKNLCIFMYNLTHSKKSHINDCLIIEVLNSIHNQILQYTITLVHDVL